MFFYIQAIEIKFLRCIKEFDRIARISNEQIIRDVNMYFNYKRKNGAPHTNPEKTPSKKRETRNLKSTLKIKRKRDLSLPLKRHNDPDWNLLLHDYKHNLVKKKKKKNVKGG